MMNFEFTFFFFFFFLFFSFLFFLFFPSWAMNDVDRVERDGGHGRFGPDLLAG